MAIDLSSEIQCRRAYLSYVRLREASGVTEQEYLQIKAKYADRIGQWLATSPDDVTEYSISDEDFDDMSLHGYNAAANISGYDRNSALNTADAAISVTTSTANAVWTGATGGVKALQETGGDILGGIKKAVGLGKEAAENAAKKSAQQAMANIPGNQVSSAAVNNTANAVANQSTDVITNAATDAATDAAMNAGTDAAIDAGTDAAIDAGTDAASAAADNAPISAYFQAGIAIVKAAAYWISRPNQEEKEACNELLNQMYNNEMAISDQSDMLASLQSDIETKSLETAEANTTANSSIKKSRSNQFLYQATIDKLEAKLASGQELTDMEKSTLSAYKNYVQQENGKVNTVAGEIQTFTSSQLSEIDGLTTDYDMVGETLAEVQGTVDYAAEIDKAAQASAYMEATGQGLNALSGAMAAAKLFTTSGGINWVNIAMGVASAAASVSSIAAGAEQVKWAGQIGNEIAMREGIDEYNAEVLEEYDAGVENYYFIKDEIKKYKTDK